MPTNPAQACLEVGRTAVGYVVQVRGRGTLRESPALQSFADRVLASESSAGFLVVDLRECDYLDSTLLGCLAGLHRRHNRHQPHRFLVAASPERARRLLGPSRLDSLLDLVAEHDAPILQALGELAADLTIQDLGRHLMDCHRELAQIEGPEREEFQAVANRLAQELKAIEDPPTGGSQRSQT